MRPKVRGLEWSGERPFWRASRKAVRAGYPIKSVNLVQFASDLSGLSAQCARLNQEMDDWLDPPAANTKFTGTIGSLIKFYRNDEHSPYRKLQQSSAITYDVYCRKLVSEVGSRRINEVDARDISQWFKDWSEPSVADGKRTLAAARFTLVILKTALRYGAGCRLPGCAELKAILDDMRFENSKPRTAAPTASEVIALCDAAHQIGHPRAALAYALQFEGPLRQWDVIGKWRYSTLIKGRPGLTKKSWAGLMWENIPADLILRLTPGKTERTTVARLALDLRQCPIVMRELSRVPMNERNGPLILNLNTGLPYTNMTFQTVWRRCTALAGIDPTVWNRDLRAGGNTEAQQAGARLEDRQRTMGHSASSRVTVSVYDRDALAAQRRVAEARKRLRLKERNKAKPMLSEFQGVPNGSMNSKRYDD